MPEINDNIFDVRGHLHIVLRGHDGQLKEVLDTSNLVVTVGKEGIAAQLLETPAFAKPGWIAVGTSATEAKAEQTALGAEIAASREALTSKTRAANVITMKSAWGIGVGTGTIVEAGIFNASSAGNMYARSVFGAVTKAAADSLEITWTLTIG